MSPFTVSFNQIISSKSWNHTVATLFPPQSLPWLEIHDGQVEKNRMERFTVHRNSWSSLGKWLRNETHASAFLWPLPSQAFGRFFSVILLLHDLLFWFDITYRCNFLRLFILNFFNADRFVWKFRNNSYHIASLRNN